MTKAFESNHGHPGLAPGSSQSAKARSFSTILALMLFPPAAAFADYQSGLNAYNAGFYANALRDWKQVADSPQSNTNPAIYAETLYAIAMLYWMGQGVTQNYYNASNWLLKAANLGHAGAQAKLGYLYTEGIAVEQDYKQAFQWFTKAARQGDIDGQYNLGIFYLNGWGTEQDTTMGKQYLAAAAAQGDKAAEAALTPRQSGSAQLPSVPEAGSRMSLHESGMTEDEQTVSAQPPSTGPSSIAEQPSPSPRHSGIAEQLPESTLNSTTWILQQPSSNYTIQVIALSSRSRLETLIEGHEQLAPFAAYTVQASSKPIYILIQGIYANVDAARKASDNFPRAIQKTEQLWIRQFGKIQALILAEEGGSDG